MVDGISIIPFLTKIEWLLVYKSIVENPHAYLASSADAKWMHARNPTSDSIDDVIVQFKEDDSM